MLPPRARARVSGFRHCTGLWSAAFSGGSPARQGSGGAEYHGSQSLPEEGSIFYLDKANCQYSPKKGVPSEAPF
jgi:hypothetical protein